MKKTDEEKQRLQARLLQIDTGTSGTWMSYGMDQDAMDGWTHEIYWRSKAESHLGK